MKKCAICFCAIAAMFMCGCITAPFEPPMGIITTVTAPLSTEGPIVYGPKKGEAVCSSVLGIVSTGDCSIAAAAKNGGLTKINHVDYQYKNYIGVYQEVKVIVYGE